MRRSKGARRFRFFEICLGPGLEPIFFHPPVQGAATQAQRLCGLTHVALKALQRFANQDTFYGLKTLFFQILGPGALRGNAKVGRLNLVGSAH